MKGLMESPPTPQETSILQDTLRVNWMGTRTQETKTSLSSSTIPTGTSNNLDQPVSIISILSRRSRNGTPSSSCWFPGLGSCRDSCHFRNSTADFPSSKCFFQDQLLNLGPFDTDPKSMIKNKSAGPSRKRFWGEFEPRSSSRRRILKYRTFQIDCWIHRVHANPL